MTADEARHCAGCNGYVSALPPTDLAHECPGLHDARERGLDVERLAEAIRAAALVPRSVTVDDLIDGGMATDLAREYARLSDRVPGETPRIPTADEVRGILAEPE